jgi:hypothetical protein
MRTGMRKLVGVTVAGLALAAPGWARTGEASSGDGSDQAFTACVRENGVKDFAGVTITDDGRIQLNVPGSGTNVFSTEYRKAVAACRHLLPSGSTVPADPEPAAPSGPAAPEPPR